MNIMDRIDRIIELSDTHGENAKEKIKVIAEELKVEVQNDTYKRK